MATDDATRLKTITDNIEAAYQSLRSSAANISGLLQAGTATCDEIKAYNLWALAIYNSQKGMLDTLRANGETNVPDLPQAPTLFVWDGVEGADAWQLDCSNEASSLSGLMKRTLKGPTPTSRFLSAKEIKVATQDQYVFNPEAAPSFASLLQVQAARQQQGAALGVLGVLIVIAAMVVAVSVAIAAIMSYLKTSSMEEANTEQVKAQATAFANYTAARLQCNANCAQGGGTAEDCAASCAKLVTAPNIKLPGQIGTGWGVLQWVGLLTVLGGVSFVGYKAYKHYKAGGGTFHLPDFHEALQPIT